MESIPKYIFLGFVVVVVGVLVAIGLYSKTLVPPEPPLKGAGSSFVAPLMVQWASMYEKADDGCRIGYKSLGSGAGITLITEGKVDFGCSNAPMTDAQLAAAREAGDIVLHIPLVLGAVVPAYNLSEVKEPLKFTGPLLADIYLGKVKKWNDKALQELNPGMTLPDKEIVVVHRSDGSGTTYIWVDYLSKVSPEWKKKVGVGTKVEWPVGAAEGGNEGVSAKVQKTPGCLGYVELAYVYRMELAHGFVQNRDKEFVKASLRSITSAANNALAEIPDDLRYSLTDPPGKDSYPISGTTWALVRADQPTVKGHQMVHFLRWATGFGQGSVKDLLYARLPDSLVHTPTSKLTRSKWASEATSRVVVSPNLNALNAPEPLRPNSDPAPGERHGGRSPGDPAAVEGTPSLAFRVSARVRRSGFLPNLAR